MNNNKLILLINKTKNMFKKIILILNVNKKNNFYKKKIVFGFLQKIKSEY